MGGGGRLRDGEPGGTSDVTPHLAYPPPTVRTYLSHAMRYAACQALQRNMTDAPKRKGKYIVEAGIKKGFLGVRRWRGASDKGTK